MTSADVVTFPGKRKGGKKPAAAHDREPVQPVAADEQVAEAAQTVAAGQLRSFIERAERLYEEDKAIKDDLKELFAEARGTGFHVKAMKTIIRLRKMDQNERLEEESILDLYKAALGMA
jgi:uncharacterized protein (UPF0335 family)